MESKEDEPVSDETAPKPEPKTVPLTPVERDILTGMVAMRNAGLQQIEGYMVQIASRLGLARNRVADANVDTGMITLASDAPTPAVPEEAAKA